MLILPLTFAILASIHFNLSQSVEHLSDYIIERTTEKTRLKLIDYFDPVWKNLYIARDWSLSELDDDTEITEFNKRFIPLLKHYPQISAIVAANSKGKEHMLLQYNEHWLNRIIVQRGDSNEIIRQIWNYDKYMNGTLQDLWIDPPHYDPRTRPWFKGAVKNPTEDDLFWTNPYTFYTTKQPGITASIKAISPNDPNNTQVIALDIHLIDISNFTKSIDVSKNGIAFIISGDDRIVGLPRDERFEHPDSVFKYVLHHVDSIGVPELTLAYHTWKENPDAKKSFQIKFNGEEWHCGFKPFPLGTNHSFVIGVALPEKDFLAEMRRTQIIILVGFVFILVLTYLVIQGFIQKQRANITLTKQNHEISLQKNEIEKQRDEIKIQRNRIAKQQKELTDSINYASRIQNAILPPQYLLKNTLPESFVFYRPKHIVSGDFYWISTQKNDLSDKDTVIVAAADCTGHGVPGAFLSMLGMSMLNEIVIKNKVSRAGDVLEQLRLNMKKSLRQTGKDDETKDGMDIALCVINPNENKLQFAGAYNPLIINRKMPDGTCKLIEIKGDRMPVGIHIKEQTFTNHNVDLQDGDMLYIFTDGFVDQVGGTTHTKFKSPRFKNLLRSLSGTIMPEQRQIIEKAFYQWKGKHKQVDDVLVFGMKV